MPLVSIVLPIYNEEENVPILVERVLAAVEPLRDRYAFELLLVNDGSTDGSLAALRACREKFPAATLRIINLDRNWGLTAAMDAGFRHAAGEIAVTLDADLQNDPQDIPRMLAAIGPYDVVIGVRARRNDPLVKRVSSKIANFIRNTLTRENVRDTGCSLKAYKIGYLRKIKLFTGLHRFLPTLLKWEGARVLEVEVRHHPRLHGTAKYHLFNRLIGPFLDLLAVMWMRRRHLGYRTEEV